MIETDSEPGSLTLRNYINDYPPLKARYVLERRRGFHGKSRLGLQAHRGSG